MLNFNFMNSLNFNAASAKQATYVGATATGLGLSYLALKNVRNIWNANAAIAKENEARKSLNHSAESKYCSEAAAAKYASQSTDGSVMSYSSEDIDMSNFQPPYACLNPVSWTAAFTPTWKTTTAVAKSAVSFGAVTAGLFAGAAYLMGDKDVVKTAITGFGVGAAGSIATRRLAVYQIPEAQPKA